MNYTINHVIVNTETTFINIDVQYNWRMLMKTQKALLLLLLLLVAVVLFSLYGFMSFKLSNYSATILY